MTRHALSIDFEDWYQAFAARGIGGWEQFPSRVPQDTERLLSLFARHDVRCTFFILGQVAEQFPDEVRAIHRAGHEIASHCYRHVPLFKQEPARFEREMRESLDFIGNLIGEPVLGFRAPFFSLRHDSLWAIDSLHRLGLRYDSSINPIASALHGYRDARRTIFTHPNGLIEFPITTCPVLKTNVPIGGGVYHRLLPYPVIRAGLRRVEARGEPLNIYYHPREFDPDLPRINAGWKMHLINYAGTSMLQAKLERLMRQFPFVPMREILLPAPA